MRKGGDAQYIDYASVEPPERGSRELIHTYAPVDYVVLLIAHVRPSVATNSLYPMGQTEKPPVKTIRGSRDRGISLN